MKPLTVFILKLCPYCVKARTYIDELMSEPQFSKLDIQYIYENKEKELADSFDYYYVPAFYQERQKLHEGAVSKEQVREILKTVLES